MYYLMGFNKNLENVAVLSGYSIRQRVKVNIDTLKSYFKDYLRTIQPAFTITSDRKLEFVSDINESKKLLKFYSHNTTDFDVKRLKASLRRRVVTISKKEKLKLLKNGYDGLIRLEPKLATLFSLIINKVFYYELANCDGGSTPDAYGVIFANPKLSWKIEDMVEFYMHELTHNLLYLDEECHSHYKDYRQLNIKRNYALSAIRRQRRRLDQALHSLVVGTELLLLREKRLGHPIAPIIHPKSEALVASCDKTIRSIRSLPWQSLLAPRGKDILAQCGIALKKIKRKMATI